jgi:hypothetical protein
MRHDTKSGYFAGSDFSAGEAAVGGEATIAPIAANLFGEASVKREAPPGQCLERCSVAPVQRQKATRFAGRRASQPCLAARAIRSLSMSLSLRLLMPSRTIPAAGRRADGQCQLVSRAC